MKLISAFCLLLIISSKLIAQDLSPISKFRFFSFNASIITRKSLDLSLLSKNEYGLSDNLSVLSHPITLFLSPSVDIKWKHYEDNKFEYSTIHGLNYPTPLLRIISMKGTGGIISPEFNIANMISIRNGIIGTYCISENRFLSGKFIFEFALGNSNLDEGTSIDLPIIAPRSAVYYKDIGFNLGLSYEEKISGYFDYLAEFGVFIFPYEKNTIPESQSAYIRQNQQNFFFESTLAVIWNGSKRFQLGFGLQLLYGNYAFGKEWHLLPYIDFRDLIDL